MNKEILYDDSMLEIARGLFEVSQLIGESSEALKKSIDKFSNDSFGYLGKAKGNTNLLSNNLKVQMDKLSQFYAITAMSICMAYEEMNRQDVYISRNLTMY